MLSNPPESTNTVLPSVAVSPADGFVVSDTFPAKPLMLLAAIVVVQTAPGVQLTVTGVEGEMAKSCTVTVVLPLLPVCALSPGYVAATVTVVAEDGVIVTEHDAVMPVPLSVHVAPPVKLTIPVGVIGVPGELSVTVAVHDVDCPRLIVDGLHDTLVEVVLGLTTMLVVPLADAWFASPG